MKNRKQKKRDKKGWQERRRLDSKHRLDHVLPEGNAKAATDGK